MKFRIVVDELPVHKEKRYTNRALSSITTAVIHHTDTGITVKTTAIANYHVGHHNWPGIGYHFVVSDEGIVEQTNWLRTVSYHAVNANKIGIGICLKGSFMNGRVPTEEQLFATRCIIEFLKGVIGPKPLLVSGHKHFVSTACPGDTWDTWKEKLGVSGE
jgi:N-acetylmuramoyl-L-alanine amidase